MRIEAVTRWLSLAQRASHKALVKSDISVPVAFILAVIHQESHGKADAVSRSGAQGLMQLMPATAQWLGVNDAFNPAQNIDGGALYLAKLMKKFNHKLDLVAAAYNAGPGAVERAGNVIPNKAETKKYVPLVMGYMKDYEGL